ncbi:hypothetical protein [Shimia abyssi]|uniref:Uncharacterized protein n=1 Tax=Shimia abyssi TaxID=1662395 RepID=A0A2P8FD74_9RHOB|nr:hypothetical protein [Shimia abyssi]PSL19672.1 hypothetical protein CLV88_10594 [Shimia abyssi]
MVNAKNRRKSNVGFTSVLRRYRVGAVLGGALLLTGAVQAETPPIWEGYWSGNASWCVRAGEVGDETPTWFGRDGFFGIEWSCEIDGVVAIGVGQSWSIQTTCLDAGFEYTQSQIFLVTYEDRLLILDETGETANLVRCALPEGP